MPMIIALPRRKPGVRHALREKVNASFTHAILRIAQDRHDVIRHNAGAFDPSTCPDVLCGAAQKFYADRILFAQRRNSMARRRSTARIGITGLGQREELAPGLFINTHYRAIDSVKRGFDDPFPRSEEKVRFKTCLLESNLGFEPDRCNDSGLRTDLP